ncbi:MAG: argininosuccinate lyase [Sedimentisphaerales bacterium]|nr:argininosuccinate lyase [Sedimentisphaerales bacterium]
MAKSKRSWEKRLAGQREKLVVDFVQSLSVDKRIYKYDIVGSITHAQMLAEKGLITKKDFGAIKNGLIEISQEIAEGKFRFDASYEDIHMAVEEALVAKIGDAGRKLHTGRSRNDQVSTDTRLWMRDEIEILQAKITLLQRAFVKQAKEYTDDLMPAYTHLQRAQPVAIGAYLLSFVEKFERDYIRLGNCRELANASPLGSGAVAGSTLPLDRKKTAKQLGFSDITYSSIDSAGDRDFCAEFIFDCALIATHLSGLAEDWIIYCSSEFGLIRIDDSYCTSSSMMPQKRNPDVLELIRGRAASVYGSLMAMLTILKAQPTGYNRDLQEDKVHLFNAGDTTGRLLDIADGIVVHTSFERKKILDRIDDGFLDATALAEYLVSRQVAFREAHGIVATLVNFCEKQGRKFRDLELSEFKKHSPAFEEDVYKYIGAANAAKRYATDGAGGPGQTKEQINYWQKQLSQR